VRIVRPRQGKADTGDEHELALPGLPLPGYAGLRFGLPAGRRLHREWRHSKPDLVHVVTEGPLGWSAVSAARRLGIPVTSGFHTNFDRYSLHYGLGWMRPAVAAYLRSLHRRTRATMVPTAALAADLAGEGLSGVRVVGRGVDAELFDPERRDPALRKRWGVADEGPVCLYVGRLAPEKNLALVERSFAAIQVWHPRRAWCGSAAGRRQNSWRPIILITISPACVPGPTLRRTTPAPTSSLSQPDRNLRQCGRRGDGQRPAGTRLSQRGGGRVDRRWREWPLGGAGR
jgi:glycosyltransferase involved in cell wall biosynthesis